MFDSKDNTIVVLKRPELAISKKNSAFLYQCNCLEEILRLSFVLLDDLEKTLRNAGANLEDVSLLESEQELRLAMSIAGLITVQCSDKDFLADFIDPKYRVEELCLKAFRMSLDIAVIPIKKFLFIYCFYLEGLFGGPPQHTVEPVRCVTKEVYIAEFRKKQAKAKEPSNPIEDFYVIIRHKHRNDTFCKRTCYRRYSL
eukprot:TRINITY_DN11224_c0_g2_i6.p1 TRINITY_DN11224_c0_g2~~TRINITY_DN11224_c0_g2_i6.p1  ORF type:complete len:199 (+),score=32.41 TRINITY_DN11224_c0_g2_i6:292-888(+)